jgi:hypothetical protein
VFIVERGIYLRIVFTIPHQSATWGIKTGVTVFNQTLTTLLGGSTQIFLGEIKGCTPIKV